MKASNNSHSSHAWACCFVNVQQAIKSATPSAFSPVWSIGTHLLASRSFDFDNFIWWTHRC